MGCGVRGDDELTSASPSNAVHSPPARDAFRAHPLSQIGHSSSDNAAMTTNDGLGSSRTAWTLVPIIAASGFAGLGYEMVWTRVLSVALGTEMMAVLGSVA